LDPRVGPLPQRRLLHKDCPKRAAANAAAAAKKAVAGAQAYVAELPNDEDDSIIFVEIPAGDPLPAKTAPVPVAAATAGSTAAAAVVVDYIGLALQFSAFVIVLAVLALVLFDSPSPSPPVSAGVFAVLPPTPSPQWRRWLDAIHAEVDGQQLAGCWHRALLPPAPAADWTAWICSTVAIGGALLFHYLRMTQGASSTVRSTNAR
jgi:hypothetical protein